MMIDPQQTSSSPKPVPPSKTFVRSAAALFIGMVIVAGVGFQIVPFSIFSRIETCIYILALSSPVGFVLYVILKPKLDDLQRQHQKADLRIMFVVVFCFVTILTIIPLNVYMDNSLPEKKTFQIIGKHYQTHKSSKSYYADITRPDFVKLPYFFSDNQSIHISAYEYQTLTPYSATVELAYHTGALGFPWYESYDLKGLADKPTLTIQTLDASPDEIKSACLWTSRFDADKDIPQIAPDNYLRDFWDGNKPRSVEPTVKGQRHGIAHYTFANGRTYSDIPWNHGQKHGVFTLYRENGIPEQTLSYKDGRLYGISKWFDTSGKLSQSYLYLNDQKPLAPSLCNNSANK